MNVKLDPLVVRYAQKLVKEGHFRSVDEAVNEVLLQAIESDKAFEKIRAEVAIGIAEADRDEFVEFTAEDIIAEGRARLAAKRKGA